MEGLRLDKGSNEEKSTFPFLWILYRAIPSNTRIDLLIIPKRSKILFPTLRLNARNHLSLFTVLLAIACFAEGILRILH